MFSATYAASVGQCSELEVQETVVTYRDDDHATGCCYRCLYPTPHRCIYDAYDSQLRRSKDSLQLVRGRCSDQGPAFRISCEDCAKVRKAAAQAAKQGQVIVPDTYLLLDTRVRIQFEMVHFLEAVNIPTLRLWNRITPN
ncbi:hypothetical protein PsorP6_012672 [Peronosclerospora sorghi]|uniref:Uncharacterized protein n=1 Tax=Peronosclerospora sorghi TaxID=230839 RepID=A0ACC0WIM4_9STRA|nr:hypothetical protein PsorP6_012672 [Peronosclerospora sorghi]